MRFCYVDETGFDGESPLAVFVGIVADGTRIHLTRREFDDLFEAFADLPSKPIQELKGSNIYRGKGRWNGVDPEDRHDAIARLCVWVADRRHRIALSALPVDGHRDSALAAVTGGMGLWLCGSLHVALQVQKEHQSLPRNKGVTVLVFDENKMTADALADLLYDPPSWTDDYYGRDPTEAPLSQIIDSSFYVRSEHAGLVQAADVFAFIFRRYSEITDFGLDQEFDGELEQLTGWVDILASQLLPRPTRWIRTRTSDLAAAFTDAAPGSLADLGA